MSFGMNKALSSYIEMNRDKSKANEEEAIEEKKVYPKVDIDEAMSEIENSLSRVNSFVETDLKKIAALDMKIHSIT